MDTRDISNVEADNFLKNEASLITLESCHLSLLCALAYFEDGVISQDELSYLLNKADEIIVYSSNDRHLYIKEQIADILDLLRNQFYNQDSKCKSKSDAIADVICEIINQIISTRSCSGDLDKYLDDYYKDFEDILSINNKISKGGEKILSLVRHKFNIPSSTYLNLASIIMMLGACTIYYFLYLLICKSIK